MRLHRFFAALVFLGLAAVACLAEDPKPGQAKQPRPSIYDKNADAKAQVSAACAKASRSNKRVLLMFGGDWCGWCRKLHDLFARDQEIHRLLSEEYELVMVDTKAPNAEALLERCAKGQGGVGFPFLAVMDTTGDLLIGQKTDPLEEKDHHDPRKVKDFLARWVAPRQDARTVLQAALDRASAEDKKVLLTFGAPWCGWCHKLEDFLARSEIQSILARDFVVQKIDVDRMNSGQDVLKTYRPDESGGIPWTVVLDGKGTKLATSDRLEGPVKNIGYPAEPKEIDAYLGMLQEQTRRITKTELARVRQELSVSGEKILADRKERAAAASKARLRAN